MTESVPRLVGDVGEIGRRVRLVRKRRGLGLAVAAGLAGISKAYLSMLERGERGFNRRGLVEDLARALGCSVVDLTGQPYQPFDRDTADTALALRTIREVIHSSALDNPPDRPARAPYELQPLVTRAHEHVDGDRYALAGQELATLVAELHVSAAASDGERRRLSLVALVEACHVACMIAWTAGYADLGLAVATRELEAATLLDDPAAIGLARFAMALSWTDVGARGRAETVNDSARAGLQSVAHLSGADTAAAEMLGMNHLYAAKLAARTGRADLARDHLGEARSLARHTGERNALMQHFGPTNVELWALAVGIETGTGPRAYEEANPERIDVARMGSPTRTGWYHLDLARALAQGGGSHDSGAIRHLDLADRAAPVLMRSNSIARDLLVDLRNRSQRRVWELDSLSNRFGIERSRGVR